MQNVHELRDADHRTKHERVAALSKIILFVLVEPRPALARVNQQRATVIRRPFAVLDQLLPAHNQGGVGLANGERLHDLSCLLHTGHGMPRFASVTVKPNSHSDSWPQRRQENFTTALLPSTGPHDELPASQTCISFCGALRGGLSSPNMSPVLLTSPASPIAASPRAALFRAGRAAAGGRCACRHTRGTQAWTRRCSCKAP